MRYSGLIFVLFLSVTTSAQPFTYPVISSEAATISSIIPEKWFIRDSVSGDLNHDGVSDLVLIIQLKDSVTISITTQDITDTFITQPRILLLLFRAGESEYYRLIAQQNSFIPLHDSPVIEDPLDRTTIINAVINFNFHYFYTSGSWIISNNTYRIRYQQEQFVLIGAEEMNVNRSTGEMETCSINFLTGKMYRVTGKNISGKNEHLKSVWKKLPDKEPIQLRFLNSRDIYRYFY